MVKIFKSRQGGQKLLDSYDRLLGLWGVPVEESDVETRYGATHVVAAGDSNLPPLVLFHGVGDNSAIMWVYNAAALAAHFRLYAIDTMGGPGKSRPNGQYGKGFRQELWLDDVLDGLSLKQAYLAGVSNGAYLAQLYAARRPERVARCACLAGSLALGSGSPLPRMLRLFLPEALLPELSDARPLPDVPPSVPPGLPVDLIRRRPDVRAAERQLAVATADIGVAVADLYPKISLSAAPQLATAWLGSFFLGKSLQITAQGQASFPIFDFGRRRAVVGKRREQREQAYWHWRQTVLGALRDVEDALARTDAERRGNAELRSGVEDATRALATVDAQYRAGLENYTPVLDAQQQVLEARSNLSDSDVRLRRDLASLYKALGGGWTDPGDAAASTG